MESVKAVNLQLIGILWQIRVKNALPELAILKILKDVKDAQAVNHYGTENIA